MELAFIIDNISRAILMIYNYNMMGRAKGGSVTDELWEKYRRPDRRDSLSSRGLSTIKVLLVEDSDDLRVLYNAFFKILGIKVDNASDGLKALEMITEKNYDIVFMDIQLPGLNGDKVVAKVRELGKTVPVVALTARALLEEKVQYLNGGFSGYISKPFGIDDISSIIEEVLSV